MARQTKPHLDYQQFIKNNKNLTNTETYWKFREQGGKIKKQTAQQIFRDFTGAEKYKERNKTVQYLLKEKKTKSFISIDKSKEVHFSTESPIVEKVFENVQKLYGIDEEQTKFLKVGLQNKNDSYTSKVDFQLYIPTNENSMTTSQLGKAIVKNMSTYYKNLAKAYSTKSSMVAKTQEAIEQVKQDLKGRSLTRPQMERVFEKNGFDIVNYKIFEYHSK